MSFESFWGSKWPVWRKQAAIQGRYDLRWMYRWSGMKVPQLDFEKDRTQADAIEALMDKEEREREYSGI